MNTAPRKSTLRRASSGVISCSSWLLSSSSKSSLPSLRTRPGVVMRTVALRGAPDIGRPGLDDVEIVARAALGDHVLAGRHLGFLHGLGAAHQVLERHVLEELRVHQAGDALAHALVERADALDLLLAGQHAVEPLAVDEDVDRGLAEDETRSHGDGVEDDGI